jgi:hypothetical protein
MKYSSKYHNNKKYKNTNKNTIKNQKGGAAAAAAIESVNSNSTNENNYVLVNTPSALLHDNIDEMHYVFDKDSWPLPILSKFSKEKSGFNFSLFRKKQTQKDQNANANLKELKLQAQIQQFFKRYETDKFLYEMFHMMLEREHIYSNGDWQVFYHSYFDGHVIFDVQTAIYELVYDLTPDSNRVILRLFNKDFKGYTLEKLKSKLAYNSLNNADSKIRKLLLSAVCSLFIKLYGENFTDVFIRGFRCNDIDYKKILFAIFKRFGITLEDANLLFQQIMGLEYINYITKRMYESHYYATDTRGSPKGQLLQIFIHKSIVNEITYISKEKGIPDSSAKDCSINEKQIRILLSPEYFLNPNSVRIYRYSANKDTYNGRLLFIKQIKDIISPFLFKIGDNIEANKAKYKQIIE